VRVARFLTERWLSAVEHAVRPSTFVGYRSHVTRHIVPELGSVGIADLDASMINGLYASLLSDGLCPTTVRRVHATLHGRWETRSSGGSVPITPRAGVIPRGPAVIPSCARGRPPNSASS
jgi:hypothetical protein